MSAPEFFIADDSWGEPWVWASNEGEIAAERMISLFGVDELRYGRALLDLIRAAVEGEARHVVHLTARPIAEDAVWCEECEEWVITGALEEER